MKVITRVSPDDGARRGEYRVPDLQPNQGIGAMSWDGKDNLLWIGVTSVHGEGFVSPQIWAVRLDKRAGLATKVKSFTPGVDTHQDLVDGLAYDGTDGTLWYSADWSYRVYHYSQDGALLGSFDITGNLGDCIGDSYIQNSCFNSGLAVASPSALYLGNNGGGGIYLATKNGNIQARLTDFANDRIEDLECDNTSFPGKTALWVKSAYSYELHAVEVPACAHGGVPSASTSPGRMTGGGSVFAAGGARVTHGFELHCNPSKGPNRLEVNWDNGKRFHLDNLADAMCWDSPYIGKSSPPSAGFNTYYGTGAGSYNGAPGAAADWIFTDSGEPGVSDTMILVIKDARGNEVLRVGPADIDKGNQQAHKK